MINTIYDLMEKVKRDREKNDVEVSCKRVGCMNINTLRQCPYCLRDYSPRLRKKGKSSYILLKINFKKTYILELTRSSCVPP